MTTDTNPPRLVRLRTAVIASLVSLVVGVALGTGGRPAVSTTTGQAQPSTPPVAVVPSIPAPSAEPAAPLTPSPPAPPSSSADPITITGKGISKSKPFRMSGNYTVTWSASASSSTGCYHGASLSRADGESMFEMLVNQGISGKAKETGTTQLYNLADAEYYIDASSGCAWSFTFTPA